MNLTGVNKKLGYSVILLPWSILKKLYVSYHLLSWLIIHIIQGLDKNIKKENQNHPHYKNRFH